MFLLIILFNLSVGLSNYEYGSIEQINEVMSMERNRDLEYVIIILLVCFAIFFPIFVYSMLDRLCLSINKQNKTKRLCNTISFSLVFLTIFFMYLYVLQYRMGWYETEIFVKVLNYTEPQHTLMKCYHQEFNGVLCLDKQIGYCDGGYMCWSYNNSKKEDICYDWTNHTKCSVHNSGYLKRKLGVFYKGMTGEHILYSSDLCNVHDERCSLDLIHGFIKFWGDVGSSHGYVKLTIYDNNIIKGDEIFSNTSSSIDLDNVYKYSVISLAFCLLWSILEFVYYIFNFHTIFDLDEMIDIDLNEIIVTTLSPDE